MDSGVWVWWFFLRVVSIVNVLGWAWATWTLWYRFKNTPRFEARAIQACLALVFVLGCGFRSFFPRIDVPRIALVDSWVSNVFLGRSVATIAELCFVAQWALLTREFATATPAPYTRALSILFVPLIVIAEGFSWYAVLTTNSFGNFVEESIWTLCFGMITMGAIVLMRFATRELRPILAAGAILGGLYTLFMTMVDVPMYLSRWLNDQQAGQTYIAPLKGITDAWTRYSVNGLWVHWSPEIPWMSLYFSVAVWISISVILVPPADSRARMTPDPF